MRTDQRDVMTKPLPKHALSIGRFGTHAMRKLPLAIIHHKRFNHIDRPLWTPTPTPPRKGEGSGGVIGIGEIRKRQCYPALPASVWTQASPQALASSRTRMM